MVDEGLRKAIDAAGGKQALANRLGIHVTSVMEWTRVPVGRVIQVEDVTGVKRELLRPDLYRQPKRKTR